MHWHGVSSPETVGRRPTFHLVRIIKLMLVSSAEEVGGVRRSARTREAIVALYYAALQHLPFVSMTISETRGHIMAHLGS